MGIHNASCRYPSTAKPQVAPTYTRNSTFLYEHEQTTQKTTCPAPTMSAFNMYELLADLPESDNESVASESSNTSSSQIPKHSPGEQKPDDSEESNKQEDDYEWDDEDYALHTDFDLVALEQTRGQAPIFTRALLQRIVTETRTILTQQSLPAAQRTQTSVSFTSASGPTFKIWEATPFASDVSVHYTTRVESSTAFQTRFHTAWSKSQTLRSLNPDMSSEEFCANIPPYHFTTWLRDPGSNDLNETIMSCWRARLWRTQALWAKSASCAQIKRIVHHGASKLKKPITKVVCVGLGRLDARVNWYQAVLQHMTVFSLAGELDKVNQANFPGTLAVKVIASDPGYVELDRVLLQELTSTRIDFELSDQETYLEMDANALVVTAYLPVAVPLMQILADLWAEKECPGMLIVDQMPELGRTEYCLRDRGSPGVARMLGEGYWFSKYELVDLEEELRADVYGDTGHGYWLKEMGIWLRRET